MAFTKTFGPTSGSYSTATNWRPINFRTTGYTWTLSGSGTNEYYLRLGTSNPQTGTPGAVWINGASANEGTVGSLTAGQWDYGDNDTLGYSTIYVRLSDGTDPDTKTDGYVQMYQIPQAGDTVVFDSQSGSITSATGLDQTATELAGFRIIEGSQSTIGSSALGFLIVTLADGTKVEVFLAGECYLNLKGELAVHVLGTASTVDGEFGLHLLLENCTTLSVTGSSSVGVAVKDGSTSAVTTLAVSGDGSRVTMGDGCTLTTLVVFAGDAQLRCSATTATVYGGQLELLAAAGLTTCHAYGGTVLYSSSVGITTVNLESAIFDERGNNLPRTITTLNRYSGATHIRNKEAVTITTLAEPRSMTISTS